MSGLKIGKKVHSKSFYASAQWLLLVCLLITNPWSRAGGTSPGDHQGIVDKYGQLHIEGRYLLNQHNDTVSLGGMSLFWSQWKGKYYNPHCIEWLRDDWKCDVVRIAVAVSPDGYLKYPKREMRKIIRTIDACIDLGIYAMVDWHSHNAEEELEAAIGFFSEIASRYGHHPNIIYEIYNEPLKVSWTDVVKPYCDTVISAIRKYDEDNIIIVGTPYWSQNVDEASEDPIQANNIAYALHFYAATHKEWLREKAHEAIANDLPIWVSEFGTCEANGSGEIDYEEMELWFEFMEEHKISWCNWSIADKEETSAALKPGANRKGGWNEEDITESGKYIRRKLYLLNSD